ncbi:hypothetical protein DH2020_001670 [Rehmannia glutinosa]|uniref:PXMP2/4 family protein n=1 Tax=Rehmannia glutinosa TaxID=99300 RepID=A0ABR0XRS0_REHGL
MSWSAVISNDVGANRRPLQRAYSRWENLMSCSPIWNQHSSSENSGLRISWHKRAWAAELQLGSSTEGLSSIGGRSSTPAAAEGAFSLSTSRFGFSRYGMLRLWKWYQNCLATHPVKTQVGEDRELQINWRRVATTSLFGLGFVGPVGHFWYEGLDRVIRSRLKLRPNSFRFVGAKVAVDGLIFGPLDLLVFFTYMGFSTGKNAAQVKEDVKRDFLPALVLEGGVWANRSGGQFPIHSCSVSTSLCQFLLFVG